MAVVNSPEAVVIAKDEMKRYLPFLGTFRYIRNSFWNAGQDSFTQAPAQSEDLFERLTNIQPIMRGVLERRWGYGLWATPGTQFFQPVRMVMYQRDADSLRAVVACDAAALDSTAFLPYYENGTPLVPNTGFFTEIVAPGIPPSNLDARGTDSRSWLYTNCWDGTYHYKWGGAVPPAAPVVANVGAGGISGTNAYVIAYVDASGVIHAGSAATSLASANNLVQINSPASAVGMVSYAVYINAEYYVTTPIGTNTLMDALTGGAGPALLYEQMQPVGAIAPANAPTFSITFPTGATRTVTDGEVEAGFTSLTSATANFTYADTGASVTVAGAGPSGATLTTNIQEYNGPTLVTLATPASTTVSGVSTTITDLPSRTVTDGAIASGSTTFTSATANFVSTDVGANIYVLGAFLPLQPALALVATITAVLNSTTVTLSVPAGSTVVGALTYIVSLGYVVLNIGRIYFTVFQSTLTGHVSDLSPASLSTGPQTMAQIVVNVSTAVIGPATPGMDQVVLLATVDGGDEQTLYKVAQGPVATTTQLTDGLPEATLLTQPVYYNVDAYGNNYGAVGNDPPPVQMGQFVKHQGRLFGFNGQNVWFSKSINEVITATGTVVGHYEECWPFDYFFDISQQAESVRALFSDGTTLYIASERTIYRLLGNTPLAGTTGTTFQEPEVVFNDVGVANPDVWVPVYNAGQPIGTCWLTPELRVILSDFNSYQDIGHPVQDVLNSINTTALAAANAMFVSSGSYDLYKLAIPTGTNTTCDTVLVFNMRTAVWTVELPTNLVTAQLFDITESGETLILSAVIGDSLYNIVNSNTSYLTDTTTSNSHGINATMQTSWLSLQDMTMRKVLNQLEVITGDPTNLQISMYGANSEADFLSPIPIFTNQNLTESVFGSWFVYLAGYASVFRYFKFVFYEPGGEPPIVGSFAIRQFNQATLAYNSNTISFDSATLANSEILVYIANPTGLVTSWTVVDDHADSYTTIVSQNGNQTSLLINAPAGITTIEVENGTEEWTYANVAIVEVTGPPPGAGVNVVVVGSTSFSQEPPASITTTVDDTGIIAYWYTNDAFVISPPLTGGATPETTVATWQGPYVYTDEAPVLGDFLLETQVAPTPGTYTSNVSGAMEGESTQIYNAILIAFNIQTPGSLTTARNLLEGFNLEAVPFNRE